jgi:hypothetical protein
MKRQIKGHSGLWIELVNAIPIAIAIAIATEIELGMIRRSLNFERQVSISWRKAYQRRDPEESRSKAKSEIRNRNRHRSWAETEAETTIEMETKAKINRNEMVGRSI